MTYSPSHHTLAAPWIDAVENTMVAFARADTEACSQKLPGVFEAAWSWLENEDVGCRKAAESALCAMVRYCITDTEILKAAELAGAGSKSVEAENTKKSKKNTISPELKATVVGSVISRLDTSLHAVAYAKATSSLLSILTALISRLRIPLPSSANTMKQTAAAETLLSGLIIYVGGLRLAKSFEYREKADEVLGMAIRVLGPEVFLRFLPLNIIPECVQLLYPDSTSMPSLIC